MFSKYEDTQHIDSLHHNKKNARNNFEKDRQADGQRLGHKELSLDTYFKQVLHRYQDETVFCLNFACTIDNPIYH